MKKINIEKDILPHLLAVILFLIILFIFYHPAFLEGKQLSQHDILMAKGPAKALEDYREQTGEEGLWAANIFSGMPAYLINVRWSGDLFRYIYHASYLNLPSPARLTFPAMISFYILLLVFGVRPYLAIGGAIAYALSSFNIIGIIAGHNLKILALAYMPLVIAGVHLVFKGKWGWGFLLTLIGLYLQIRVNHLQITYYLILMLSIYGLFQFIYCYQNRKLPFFFKSLGILLIPPILVIGINLGKLWSVYSYGQYSIRGPSELTIQGEEIEEGLSKEYAFTYSYGIFEPLTLLIPNFMGGSSAQALERNSELGKFLRQNNVPGNQINQILNSGRTYWGDQPFVAGPYYSGATIIFLFIIGLLFSSGYVKKWLLLVTILALALSWGDNFAAFNYMMFDYFPGYNKFRSVTFTIIMALFSIPLLGFIGLNNVINQEKDTIKIKKLGLAFIIAGGACIVLFLVADMIRYNAPVDSQLPDWMINPLKSDRKAMMRNDAIRSFFFILLFALSIFFFIRKKIGAGTLIIVSTILILLDLWFVDKRYLKTEDFQRNPVRSYFTPNGADLQVMKDKSDYRVLNLIDPFNDGRTSYFHQSIGGYHGAKLRRYQDLIEQPLSSDINTAIQKIQSSNLDFSDNHIVNMLNTKYFLAGTSENSVIENNAPNGSAWFIQKLITVNSPSEEIEMLRKIDTKAEAVIDVSRFDLSETKYDSSGNIQLLIKEPSYLKYETKNPRKGFIVLSEIFYPQGWIARINGEDAEIKRVNYVLRGMVVPPGENTIELFFRPGVYYIGNKIMFWFSLITYLIIIGVLFQHFRMIKINKT